MFVLKIVFLASALVCASAFTGHARISSCPGSSKDICEVSAVRFTPCTEGRVCPAFIKNKDYTMSVDFTPNFAADTLKFGVYGYNGEEFQVIPKELFTRGHFSDEDSEDSEDFEDACAYTSCPSLAGVKQTLNYDLRISNKTEITGPLRTMWKIWNANKEDQVCCFTTYVQLFNPPRLDMLKYPKIIYLNNQGAVDAYARSRDIVNVEP